VRASSTGKWKGPASVRPRRWCARCMMLLLALAGAACTTRPTEAAWEDRLRGEAIVLFGEVHDNAAQHRLRLEVLERAFAAGWRPAIAMEQFDRERQTDIDRARRERPADAQYLIDQAVPAGSAQALGWHWAYYRPYVALALRYDVPLLAANLSNRQTTQIVRAGYGAVFDPARVAELGLDRTIAPGWLAAQEHEIDSGHCHALPPTLWPAMARAQFARDAVMAEVVRAHAAHGLVLLAGNGHVRRDLGVPRWLEAAAGRVYSIGLLEDADQVTPASAFDVVVRTPTAQRPDPCAQFRRQDGSR
jgi:uncharacterized iron-regulated protein